MISQILDYTKKYYPYSLSTGTFTFVSDGIEGSFTDAYLVGQYVNVQHSFLNDGTYKVTGVTASKLTLDATLQEESTNCYVWGLKLPTAFLSLVSDIETFVAGQSSKADLDSEKQGNRQVKYKNGSTWQSAFSVQLNQYKNVFDDRLNYCRRYNVVTKG